MEREKVLTLLGEVQKKLRTHQEQRNDEMENGDGDNWKIRCQYLQGWIEALEFVEKGLLGLLE